MTLENAKKLYKHYIKKGMKKEAEDMARNRPEVLKEEPVEEKIPITIQKKKKKRK